MKEEVSRSLYRRYRPQTFADVRGQEHVVSVLSQALRDKKTTHAYLFTGSRGTGKTSIARIFARELGCEPEDLYEIDGASNRGIDEIRALKESVQTRPFRGTVKVYVIDEVHMLTKDAFNALLKTLEEPPEFVTFILATTELHKIPETILSRCQSFIFKKPNEPILRETLLDAAKKEKIKLADDAATLLAFLADGSFRDAYVSLEQIIHATGGKEITASDVEKILGIPQRALVHSVVRAAVAGDTEKGITTLITADDKNIDMKLFTKLIIKTLRNALILRYAPTIKTRLTDELGEAEITFLNEINAHASANTIPQILRTFLDAYDSVRNAYIESLPLTLALTQLSQNKKEL
jgi:DNA polymerase-3 subunit gamma/tau